MLLPWISISTETIDSTKQWRKNLVNVSWLLGFFRALLLWNMYRIFVGKTLGQLKYESLRIDFVTFHLNKAQIPIFPLDKNQRTFFLLLVQCSCFYCAVHNTHSSCHFACERRVLCVCVGAPIVAALNFCCRMYLIFPIIFDSIPRTASQYIMLRLFTDSSSVYSSYTYSTVLHMFILSFDLFWFWCIECPSKNCLGHLATFGWCCSKQSYLLHGNRLKLLPYCWWAYILQCSFQSQIRR